MGMDLYVSGHEHAYERSYGICLNSQQIQIQKPDRSNQYQGEVFESDCPIYVIEGAAGGGTMVELNETAATSGKIIAGRTGFGYAYVAEYSGDNHHIYY